MTWNNYDPAKPPGDDDWPIIVLQQSDNIHAWAGCNHWDECDSLVAWMPIPKYAPPEPDLPKLYLGGEEIQFEEQLNGWRVSSEGNVYVDNLNNYPTRAEAHAAVVELLESFRVGDGPSRVDNKLFDPFTFSQSEVDALVMSEALEKYNLRDAIDAILKSPPCRICGSVGAITSHPTLDLWQDSEEPSERITCHCHIYLTPTKWRKLMGPQNYEQLASETLKENEQLREQLASAERVTDNMAQHRPDTLSGKLAIQHRAKYPKEKE